MRIAVYITGHGYGHAIRALTVMQALQRVRPATHFHLRTIAPRKLFQGALSEGSFVYTPVQLDTGGVELGLLDTDIAETVQRAKDFLPRLPEIITAEANFCEAEKIDLVLFDVPAAAAQIACRAGIPSVALANFTWSGIYEEYPETEYLVDQLREWYSSTTLALQTPLGYDLDEFPLKKCIPLIARRSTAHADAVRRELGLHEDQIAVLMALRGLPGVPHASDPRIVFLSFDDIEREHVIQLGNEWQPRFPDVLMACNAVLSKPGYGIVGECIAAQKPLLMLPRTGFRETRHLLEDMEGTIPHAMVTMLELQSGSFEDKLHEVLQPFWPSKRIPHNGAEIAAREILALMARDGGFGE